MYTCVRTNHFYTTPEPDLSYLFMLGGGFCRKVYPYLSPCTVKSKWVKDLNIKPDTLNLLQEIVEKSFEHIGTGDNFRNPFVRSGFH